MSLVNWQALENTPLKTTPYHYMVVRNFVPAAMLESLARDFPPIQDTGSFPLEHLQSHGSFKKLVSALMSDDFCHAIERKFSLDLSPYTSMMTVRGFCGQGDGKIHTDSQSKIITILLYLNQTWTTQSGRLRILNSGHRLDDIAEEVPPYGGTLLAFRRSNNSWHGHEPFEGERRSLQMNWVKGHGTARREQYRHKLSSLLKSFKARVFKPASS